MTDLEFSRHMLAIHWHLENLQKMPQYQANQQLRLEFERIKQAIETEVDECFTTVENK